MASRGNISPDVAAFLRTSVDSLLELEVLLFLRETSPREWRASDLSAHLGLDERVVHGLAARLDRRGLVATTGGGPQLAFCYQLRQSESVLNAIAALYVSSRAALVSLIGTEHVDPMRSFSDAFKIREDC